jgi:hypothetical protein
MPPLPRPAPAPAPRAPASPLALRGDPRGGWTPSPPRARSREGSPGEEDVALARAAPPPASPSGGGLPTLRARVPAPGEHHEHEHPRRLAELASEVPMLMMISLEPGRSPADLRADREAVAACLDDFYAELHRRRASGERARAGAGAVIARSAPDGGGGSPAAAARELRGACERSLSRRRRRGRRRGRRKRFRVERRLAAERAVDSPRGSGGGRGRGGETRANRRARDVSEDVALTPRSVCESSRRLRMTRRRRLAHPPSGFRRRFVPTLGPTPRPAGSSLT